MPVDLRIPDLANQRWRSLYSGKTYRWDTTGGGGTAGPAWSDTNLPWTLQAGETVDDNMPAGVNVVNYSDFGDGSNFGATMAAIRSAQTQPYYVRLNAGAYHITDFSFGIYAAGVGRGYQDAASTKLWAGLIGAGADKTFIVVDPNIMIQDQLDGISAGNPNPVQVSALLASEGNIVGVPTFFSGICFRGNLQQTIPLNATPNIVSGSAPAPWQGLVMSNTLAGSMIQYCRFQGFGFDASSNPPYELGAINSSHGQWTVRRTEIDGRQAAEIDAAQPRSSGGLMTNFESGHVSVIDSWLHHTRRSGFAMHDHDPTVGGNANDAGIYYTENFQIEHMAEVADTWAGSSLGFSISNIEELRRTFTYVRPRLSSTNTNGGRYHIVVATSNGNTLPEHITVTDPICSGPDYGDMLTVRIVETPNNLGTNPVWTLYSSSGLGALPITATNQGKTLTPVLSTSYNPAVHNSANSYVVVAQ